MFSAMAHESQFIRYMEEEEGMMSSPLGATPYSYSSSLPSPSSLELKNGLRHFLRLCLKKGVLSDVAIVVFSSRYCLHKLILRQSPYFEGLFSKEWEAAGTSSVSNTFSHTMSSTSQLAPTLGFSLASASPSSKARNETTVQTFNIAFGDPNITKKSFDIALGYMYGQRLPSHGWTVSTSIGCLAISRFLGLELLAQHAGMLIMQQMGPSTVVTIARCFTQNDYGFQTEEILDLVKAFLYVRGVYLSVVTWAHLPSELYHILLRMNVPLKDNGYERFESVLELHNYFSNPKLLRKRPSTCRRKCLHLKMLLNSHEAEYWRLEFGQLLQLEQAVDLNGNPLIDPGRLHRENWLRSKIQLSRYVNLE